jgi:DNA-binding response OmpR family regulator
MPTVLLVEDDSMIRTALVKALTNAGHVVSAVGTAMDALREVAVRPPDVVVLDLGLPDVDGASALRMMRGDSDVPIIIATARTGENNIIRLLNAGADDYLTKPFSGEHLLARISAVLRRRGSFAGAPAAIEVGPLPYRGSEQTVDVHISWLRRKLGETAAKPRFLRVMRGVGIMLVDQL